jgi:hypothetical protein
VGEVPIADEDLLRDEEEIELPAPQPLFVVVAWSDTHSRTPGASCSNCARSGVRKVIMV